MKCNTYFLFGKKAIQLMDQGIDAVREMGRYEVFHCEPNTKPLDLIEAFDGWDGYMIITESQYLEFMKED